MSKTKSAKTSSCKSSGKNNDLNAEISERAHVGNGTNPLNNKDQISLQSTIHLVYFTPVSRQTVPSLALDEPRLLKVLTKHFCMSVHNQRHKQVHLTTAHSSLSTDESCHGTAPKRNEDVTPRTPKVLEHGYAVPWYGDVVRRRGMMTSKRRPSEDMDAEGIQHIVPNSRTQEFPVDTQETETFTS